MKKQSKLRLKFGGVLLLALISAILSFPHLVGFIPPLSRAISGLHINRGLDLQGGIHLEYAADLKDIPSERWMTLWPQRKLSLSGA
ncbi:MAG: hypothetical protein WDN67_04065 [Candidatus Moraniibacteriota bacterium]